MTQNRNPNARRGDGAESVRRRPVDPQSRRKRRLFVGIAILAWLGGLLAARLWWPSAGQPPEQQQATRLSPLPFPVLKPGLDPDYRALLEEAGEAARRLVESFPNDAQATAVAAMLHHLAHDKAGEETRWRRCLELDDGFSRAYQWLATRATDDGDYQKAETLMREAMAAGCKQPEFPTVLGTALMQQGKLEEAALVLENDVRANPQSVQARILLGQVYLQLTENEKAKDQFEGALLLFPTSTRAYHGLAGACAKLGLDDDAEKCREEFARLKKLEGQAEHQKQKGRKDELVAPLWFAEIMMIAGKVYLAHQRLEDAERHLLKASALDPADTECREALSALYTQQGRQEDALRIVEELKNLEPGNLTHRRSLGILHGRLGQLEAAEETFRELCSLAPQEAIGYAGLAEIYLRADKSIPEARSLASRAVGLQPTAWNYFILAAICEKDGDSAAARAAMERATALDPENPLFQKMHDAVPERP